MKILAIDTSSNICSVAIAENDKIIDEISIDNGMTHSENLMPSIEKILNQNHLKLAKVDLIACSVGPGSFTGIRIGVATVKALAEVNHIPVASVTSLETLARLDDSEKDKIVLIDARNNQVYCGVFDVFYHKKEEYMADDILTIIKKIKKYDNVVCIGSGAILHKDKLLQNIKNVKFAPQNEQSASCTALIAYKKYLENDLQNADTIVPIYLRKSQAERMKKDK